VDISFTETVPSKCFMRCRTLLLAFISRATH
jgi:hypothetical protein